MNNSKRILSLAQVGLRQSWRPASSSSKVTEVVHPGFAKLKEEQKRFQIENDIPVYIKGGLTDRILLGLTTVLVLVGVGMAGDTLYNLTFPKSD